MTQEINDRFWLIGASEEVTKALIKHNLGEMGSLAEFLPGLYLRDRDNQTKSRRFQNEPGNRKSISNR